MPTRTRKVEIHKLTISALPQGTGYGTFIRGLRARIGTLEGAVLEHGTRSHALYDIRILNQRTRMRFISYTTGHRPDILDTTNFALGPNPLLETQTGVEWTHVLGARAADGRYLLFIERVQTGIWPTTLETYLQWLVDNFHEAPEDAEQTEPVTVSIEAVPGPEFIQRMESLDRITHATVRLVRPNPGFADLKTELARESDESDAHKSEVSMTARRRASLRKDQGIIAAIRNLFRLNQLDYAAVGGKRAGHDDHFSTDKLGLFAYVPFELDAQGQVDHEAAWQALARLMDQMTGHV